MKILAFWQPRGRGVFLTIMAVPLFVTVYFLIFLDLDIMNSQSRSGSPPNYGASNGRSFIKTIVKMQRALDDLGLDLSNVISHRDLIRVKIKALINETSQWPKHRYFVDELQMVLDNLVYHNYSSVVKSALFITCNQIEAIQQLAKPKWRDTYSYTEDGFYGFQQVRTIRSRTDLKQCSVVPSGDSSKACRMYANNLALRDIMLFQQLQHPGVGQLIGYCVREFSAGVSYVIANGKTLNITEVSSGPWSVKIQLLMDLTHLMDFLLQSPLGTLRLHPLQPSSFIFDNQNELKLWDLRSVNFGEPHCQENKDCRLNKTDLPCENGLCKGFTQRQMMINVRDNFFTPLLRDVPKEENSNVKHLLKMFSRPSVKIGAIANILKKMGASPMLKPTAKFEEEDTQSPSLDPEEDQVWYTGQDSYTYRKLVNTDLPSHHDYACPRSQVTWGCVVAMPSKDSAFRRCSGDPQCRAFVVLPNATINGWSSVNYKNGYADLVDSPDSTLYIKVPIRDTNDDLRFGQNDMAEKDGAHINLDSLGSCMDSLMEKQNHVRLAREKRLLAVLGLPELTEEEWYQSVRTGVVTSTNNIKDQTFVQKRYTGPGGSLVLHMKAAPVKSVNLIIKEGPTQFQHAHLLFYYIDRLLGMYLTPPTMQHMFSKEEVKFMVEQIPGFDQKFSSFVSAETLPGILTAIAPHSIVGVNHLSIEALNNITSTVVPFTSVQQNHLEYILLLWLTGTPRYLSDVQGAKGVLLHLDSSDAFQQGVDTLLPYLYHCQYPNHVIEILRTLHREQATSPTCSFSNQVFYQLQQDSVNPEELRLMFKGTQLLANLLNKSAEKFLDIVNICIQRFGESQVLYD